ncbi:MAG: SIS domain-containing protein [Chitinivibrionales bacterium]|nr:SIS domain-containing protein [Chitinivibrionales bacterium]
MEALMSVDDIVRATWQAEAQSIARLAEWIDMAQLRKAVDALAQCRGRIITTGAGTSGAAAAKIAHSLCCIERPALFLSPADAVHGALGVVQPGDIAIAISKGGNTVEIANMLDAFAAKKATLIGVTENPDSLLAQRSDILLRVTVEREPDPFNMLATASTMAVVAVFDAICIALMQITGFTREQFGIIHPGGAVGRRLLQGQP